MTWNFDPEATNFTSRPASVDGFPMDFQFVMSDRAFGLMDIQHGPINWIWGPPSAVRGVMTWNLIRGHKFHATTSPCQWISNGFPIFCLNCIFPTQADPPCPSQLDLRPPRRCEHSILDATTPLPFSCSSWCWINTTLTATNHTSLLATCRLFYGFIW